MSSQLVGTVLIFRHGDRQGFYQSPTSYTASNTAITPLGEVQEYQLGQLIRSRYISPEGSHAISGINDTLFDSSQVYVSADAGGEGGVIYDSTVAVTQGAWPATSVSTITLANGTEVTSPLGGYQYIPVESVEVEEDYHLESWTECPAYTKDNAAWYNSSQFQAKAQEAAPFIESVSSIVGGRPATLQNWWNIFDYINVNYIHSAAFAANVSTNTLEQARALADWHEYTSFTDPSPSSIGNVAGRAMLPLIFDAFHEITNSSNPLKMRMIGISYKPFASLFNLTGVANSNPQLAGVVNYAAAVAYDLRYESVSNSYTVSFSFKNGTDDADFIPYNLFGSSSSEYDMNTFVNDLSPYSISSLGEWCNACNNTQTRGCDTIAALNTTTAALGDYTDDYASASSTTGRHHTSPLAAGFIGAAITLAIGAAAAFAAWRLGMLVVGKKGTRQRVRSANYENFELPAYDRKISSSS